MCPTHWFHHSWHSCPAFRDPRVPLHSTVGPVGLSSPKCHSHLHLFVVLELISWLGVMGLPCPPTKLHLHSWIVSEIRHDFLTVPKGHKHRVTTPENPRKIPRTPAETPQNPRRGPAEPSERPPQIPLRGKFPRRASRRVVPLGWWPSRTLDMSYFVWITSVMQLAKRHCFI